MKHPLKHNVQASVGTVVTLRCPNCGHAGAFHGVHNCHDVKWQGAPIQKSSGQGHRPGEEFYAGMRKCPNPDCECLIFVVMKGKELAASFPPEVIDFDSTNLPAPVLTTLEEAIKAHAAGCYVAAALMVRRLLEELCREKNAAGDNLKDRLSALGGSTIAPKELLDAADELRLLGNDAAHVEAKAYDEIGEPEATVAIELAKELLKAVYQYSSLVDKLRALKKPVA